MKKILDERELANFTSGLLWVAFGFILLFVIATAHCATINVVNGGSIQSAINQAAPGDLISVAAGTYPESLIVGKALSIIGATGAILEGNATREVGITLNCDGCYIYGFQIRNYRGAGVNSELWSTGISNTQLILLNVHNIGIGNKGNDFAHGKGMNFVSPKTLLIQSCTIYATDYNAIQFDHGQNITIRDCVIRDGYRVGICGDCDGITIEGCKVYNWNYTANSVHSDAVQLTGFLSTVTVSNSQFWDNTNSLEIQPYSVPGQLGTNPGGAVLIFNCLIRNSAWVSINSPGYPYGTLIDHGFNPVASVRMRNCTMVDMNGGPGGWFNDDREASGNPRFTMGTAEITNCIFKDSLNGINAALIETTPVTSGNVYWYPARGWALPGFKNLADFKSSHPGQEVGSVEANPNLNSQFASIAYPAKGYQPDSIPASPTPSPSPTASITPLNTLTPSPSPTPSRTPTPTLQASPTRTVAPPKTVAPTKTPRRKWWLLWTADEPSDWEAYS